MEFKYIKNVSGQEADILLYNAIGSSVDANGNIEYGIDGAAFAQEMKYLEDRTEKINVRINSIGGSVMDGYSIMSAILNSKVPVDTHIDGLAASIAGVIAMMGKNIYMRDYGTLMLHNPSGGQDGELLNLVKKTLITVFAERRAFKEDDINTMMNTETWLDADTSKSMGFVDFVVSSKELVPVDKSGSLQNMAIIYNKVINKSKTIQMKQVANKLSLSENATESEIVAKIDSMESANNGLVIDLEAEKSKVTELTNKVEAFEKEKKDAVMAEISNSMEGYVKAGKLKADEVEKYTNLSIHDFEGVKNLLDKVEVKKVAEKVFDFKNVAGKKGAEDRSEWTMKDWQKKDVSGLEEMQNSMPEVYQELYNKTYKTK